MLRSLLAAATLTLAAARAVAQSPGRDIDANYWTAVSAAVGANDITALGNLYHPLAVVVTPAGTRPIRAALMDWGRGMMEAKAAGGKGRVSFRFALRQDGETTAFESGVFEYAAVDKDGRSDPYYTRFEALLVKHEGKWLMMMERQIERVPKAEWDALGR